MESLRYVLNAREDFDAVRAALARDSPASDVQKAAWFYQLIRYSYASGLTSFGSQPHDMRSNFPLIEQAHRRLAKVVIENKDFEKLIRQYEVPEKAQRAVAYADKQELEESIIRRHYGTVAEEEPPQDVPAAVGGMNHGMQAEKNSRKTILRP